jgi:hypothetical protein
MNYDILLQGFHWDSPDVRKSGDTRSWYQIIGENADSVQLSEIELSVEIGVKGEVKLVAGGEASGKGALKLKFTRLGGK